MTLLVVDNSVLQRLERGPAVAAAMQAAVAAGEELCSTVVSALLAGYSAGSLADHQGIIQRLTRAFTPLMTGEAAQRVALELQSALWRAGLGRAVGVVDLLLAATAVEHGAVVLHYDSDFDVLAEVDSRVRTRWVVPRGSVD